ncbi:MAG: hypothetical protein AM326_04030 [Candidatus Thorarchaeota archaeon SMTZ-45]|nr:MAG: hypothetical protein AM326_04030 [Candidatus Thorarchaeota archaeon SMTZ-45]KXH75094.1 MAG: hypothetical protein AM325_04890 [Candidatus Thorarchaeota archaeon SMTZ1-45]
MYICILDFMASAIWENERGTFLRVIVHPNSKEKRFIAEVTTEAIHINLKEPAREGRANSELLKKLSKALKISTSEISLVAGHKSREKTLLIMSVDANQIARKLLDETKAVKY